MAKIPKKKIILYGIILIAVVAGNIYIYYSNSRPTVGPMDIGAVLVTSPGGEDIATIENVGTVGHTVLEWNLFAVLKKVGNWPLVPQHIGKADPFSPVFSQ